MSGISIHYALDMIEDRLGIYRTKKANATTRVNGVLASIKALQAALDARLADIDRLQDKYAADEHLIETLKAECGNNLADKQQLAAENERLRGAVKAALGFDAHDEDCATLHPRHSRTCDCERADVKAKLKAALGA